MEKFHFASGPVGAIFYGIVVTLFIECIAALLNPTDLARSGFRWGLVVHTIVVFLSVTAYTVSYIGYEVSFLVGFEILREYSLGYFNWMTVVVICAFQLNQRLANGLLLYRCVICAWNYRAVIFPRLMYLASSGFLIMLKTWHLMPSVPES